MLLLGLGVAGFLIGVARLALVWYGQAKATAVEQWLGVQAARLRDATAAVLRRYQEIDQQPPPTTDEERERRINDAWNQKP